MIKYIFNIILASVLFSNVGHSQLNNEYIDLLESSLEFLKEEVQPIGLSIAVRSGDDLWTGTIGVSSESEPLTSESLLAMGSISKTFVSACILKMMDQEKLTLSDPINKYLADFTNVDPEITIRQLLNHSSGIYNYTDHPSFIDSIFSSYGQSHIYTEEEVLRNFVEEPNFSRGTSQLYSNTNYILLGMIISEIAQRPYYDEIIESFDLKNTLPSISIAPYLTATSEVSNLWADLGQELEDLYEAGWDLTGLFSSAGAAGAFVSNPSDLSKWGQELYSGKLLTQESMDDLFDYFFFNQVEKFGYGLGVIGYETDCGAFTVGHGGNIIYSADLQYVEEYNLSIAVMTNDGNGLAEIGGIGAISQEIICQYESTITSTNETNNSNLDITVYPNPTSDITKVDVVTNNPESVTITLLDSNGKLLWKQVSHSNGKMTQNLDISQNLEKGIYYIEIATEQEKTVKKLVKI